jgi:hypothetical protein
MDTYGLFRELFPSTFHDPDEYPPATLQSGTATCLKLAARFKYSAMIFFFFAFIYFNGVTVSIESVSHNFTHVSNWFHLRS